MFETSSLLATLRARGLVHGFTTRRGGVSRGPYSSLNLGRRWGDDPAAVVENYRRVAAAGGFAVEDICTVRQVHGRVVVAAERRTSATEADGLWTRRGAGERVVAVLTADCVPILLADADARVAAAVHSGWRGTVANIAGAAVAALVAAGVDASSLRAAIGPCIEQAAFEVGPEVAEQFPSAFVTQVGVARPHVDLVATVRAQLVAAGVPEASIERVGGCTHRHVERYFSYRRDGTTGQQLSFIGFASRPNAQTRSAAQAAPG